MKKQKTKNSRKNKVETSSFNLLFYLVFVFLALILSLSLTIAAKGCCFNPTNGDCSKYSESSTCNSPGEFFANPECTISKCESGCCILGSTTKYLTARQCEIDASAFGFEFGFQQGLDADSCKILGQAEQYGACIYGTQYERQCKYVTYSKCSTGDFYPNILCSNSTLNTICKKTNITICSGEEGNKDVYYKDTCGNPDLKKEDCDYNNGTICGKGNSSFDFSCKSLDCKFKNVTKKNGESWCVGLLAEGGLGLVNITSKKWEKDTVPVGSRSFIQRCLNGEVFTEPCADYRNEICKDKVSGNSNSTSTNSTNSTNTTRVLNQAKCEKNNWMQCLNANTASDESSGTKVNKGACSGSCKIWSPGADCRVTGRGNFCFVGNNAWPDNGNKLPDKSQPMVTERYVVESGIKSAYSSDNQKMYADLGLELCVPKVKGGIKFWGSSSSSTSSSSSVCSLGNFETTIVFDVQAVGHHSTLFGTSWTKDWVLKVSKGTYDNAGLISTTIAEWKATEGKLECTGYDPCDKAENGEMLELNPTVLGYLEARCRAISDCGGELNFVAKQSGAKGAGSLSGGGKSGETREYSFSFKCVPSKFGGNDCDKCGKDGLTCSEYRCKSLGNNCDYFEPDGSDKGYCVSSSDSTGPKILSYNQTPESPVRPYTAVEFKIKTDEASECKFNFDNAGVKFSEMKYDFGNAFGLEHTIVLTLPGQTKGLPEDIAAYSLVKEGNHTLFVRCLDAAGNGESEPAYPIRFDIMRTPDRIPPAILNFTPASGSAIRFNTTEKSIRIRLNEPAECRWSLNNKNFTLMENSFSCDSLPIEDAALRGYFCTGTLKNITKNLSDQTKFYIRCKDQPWLEGNETDLYSRNANDISREYILRASEKFEISNIAPSGTIVKGSENVSVILRVMTSGGASGGLASCLWSISSNSTTEPNFEKFESREYNTHSQTITGATIGSNYVQVICQDSADNIETKNSTFNLELDKSPPTITRIFKNLEGLKIITNEEAVCYFSLDKNAKCSFLIENSTMFSGVEKDHNAEWVYDKDYYVKCKDYRGNEHTGCGTIIRTY